MKNRLRVVAASLVGSGIVIGTGFASVSADTKSSSSGNVGNSGIPRSVFKDERQAAASEVLNTSIANIQAAHKNKTFKQLLTKDGLTKQTFETKLKSQLTSDLESKDYSQSQITIALQHHKANHMHHKK